MPSRAERTKSYTTARVLGLRKMCEEKMPITRAESLCSRIQANIVCLDNEYFTLV